MSGDEKPKGRSPVTLEGSARAGVTATLRGALRAPERQSLIFGTLFTVLAITGLVAAILSDKIWPPLLLLCAIGGLGLVLWQSLFSQRRTDTPEGESSTLIDLQEGLAFRGPLIDPMTALLTLRERVQGRKLLPPPHGEVTGNDPSKSEVLRELSEDDRTRLHAEDQVALRKFDEELVSSLNRAAQALSIAQALPEEASGELFGQKQHGSTAELPRKT